MKLLELTFNEEIPIPVPLLQQSSILKFLAKIYLENILFVSKSLNNISPLVFNTCFFSDQHSYETSSFTQG